MRIQGRLDNIFISVSIGVSFSRNQQETDVRECVNRCLKEADENMYQWKAIHHAQREQEDNS